MAIWCYNFKQEFADLVRKGLKTQTIRRLRKDRRAPMAGDIVKLYRGLRTKHTELLRVARVTRVRSVEIDSGPFDVCGLFRWIEVDGAALDNAAREQFAMADGFGSADELFTWFLEYQATDQTCFRGVCIEWAGEAP